MEERLEVVNPNIEEECDTASPTPIEDVEYLNYFEYLRVRLIEMFGEDKFNVYVNEPVISMALSTLTGDTLMDGDIINTINTANVEFMKDLSRDERFTEKDMVGYYVELKEPVSREINENDAKEHAEKMIAGFYTFLFCEVLK